MSAVEIGRAVAQLPLLLLHPVAVAVLLAVLALPLLLLPKVLLRAVVPLLVAPDAWCKMRKKIFC